jgi:cysteine-rich repeat protein
MFMTGLRVFAGRLCRSRGVVAAIVMVACASPAAAAVLEVPAGYPTIQAAINAAGPGDTVEVATGVYHEMVRFPASGSAGSPITLTAKAGHSPVLDGTGLATTDLDGLIFIEDRSYITVSNLEIAHLSASSPSHFPAGIWVRGASHHIQILGNDVHHIENAGCAACGAHGIAVYGTSASGSIQDVVINGNEVHDCVVGWSESLVVNGNVEDFTITNNVVHDNNNIGIVAIGFEGECIGCSDALDRARDGVIADNVVYNIDSGSNPAYHGERSANGIYVDGGTRIVIERNVVHHCNIGVELASEHDGKDTSEVTLRSNFVYRSHSFGISIGGYDTHRGRTENCRIVHNTLYDNDTDQTGAGELLVQYDVQNNLVENNIFYAGSQNRFITNDFSLTAGNTIDHNIYFSASGAASSEWTWMTTPYTGFAQWKSATGNDASSIFADPMLVSPATGDLHLAAGSPAIGAAITLAAGIAGTEDIDGSPRVSGAAADIGADELTCGNGVTDGDEACDDGNLASGDGCDANCTATGCANGIVTAGEDCDDGNALAGDCCSAACAYETAGAACNDSEACTFVDACDGSGVCVGAAGLEPSCDVPDPSTAGSRLKIRAAGGASNRLSWTWGKGGGFDLPSLGSPTTSDDYAFCVFVEDAEGTNVLLSAVAPAGSSWSASSSALKFSRASLTPDGLKQIVMKAGDAGRAKIKVKGQGALLALDGPLGIGGLATVSAELRNLETGECFGAVYAFPFRADETDRFDDRTD